MVTSDRHITPRASGPHPTPAPSVEPTAHAPDGRPWVPKDREARVIHYPGIERPIAIVFGEGEGQAYVISPDPERQVPFHADSLSQALERMLKELNPALSLHSLRHTLAAWRLEMGDPMIRVQSLMGYADANMLLRYAHVQVDPMADLLALPR